MKTLKLTIKKKWFDMILSGEKKEEYREIKPYWKDRIMSSLVVDKNEEVKHFSFKHFDAIHFFNGGYYSNKLPNFKIELKSIRTGTGKEQWGAVPGQKYFVLELGKILSTSNC